MASLARPLLLMAATVVAAMIIAFISSGLTFYSAWLALLIGMGVAYGITQGDARRAATISVEKNRKDVSFWEQVLIVLFVLASVRAFLWLIYRDGNVLKVLSPNNLGDLSLHMTLIRYLAVVPHWWPLSPILLQEPLRYSVGPDLFNSLLLLIGIPLEQGLILVGLLGAGLTGIALWRWGRGFGIAALLLNGGFAGVLVLRGSDPDAQVVWKNLFLSMFVTQRGFLYALPVGLLFLTTWKNSFLNEHGRANESELSFPAQILLLGAMPLFSVHSFLFLAAMMTGIILLLPKARNQLIFLALVAWPLALLATYVVSGGGGTHHFLGWNPGWMQEGNPIWFWLWNFGISLPLIFILICLLAIQKQQERVFILPAVAVFILCLLFRFAPWPWDNMKLMLWSWLTIAPFLWDYIIRPHSYWVRAIVCLLLFGSGAVTLIKGLDGRHGYEIATYRELDVTEALLKSFSPEAIIATAPDYNHPVLLLGHPVVAGYEGHLWSHGLAYQGRLAALQSIMKGTPGWEKRARALGVSAIYWSKWEQEAYPHSRLPFAKSQELPLVYTIQ